MARPRKIDTEDMLKIINDCYEEHGNTACLKCSFLAEYATIHGMDVQAYDFRRNPAVRARIGELKDLMPFLSGSEPLAYKNLDVDAFIRRVRNNESLKTALLELDASWRKIYERACTLLKEKESLAHSLKKLNIEHEQLKLDYDSLTVQIMEVKTANKDITIKNRYLTNAVREYLYAAIANEILVSEGALAQAGTQVTAVAMEVLVDLDIPAPFSKSVENDHRILSREEMLLKRMVNDIGGFDET